MAEKEYMQVNKALIGFARKESAKTCQSGELLDTVLSTLIANDDQFSQHQVLKNTVEVMTELHQEQLEHDREMRQFRDLGYEFPEELGNLSKADLKKVIQLLGSAVYVLIDWGAYNTQGKTEKLTKIQGDILSLFTEKECAE